jgi:glycosyltransferase involved in cell wall biosynthesis
MACGLPVVSSDMSFNHDILDSSNAILINPESIEEIAEAIKEVKGNPAMQRDMSNSSLEKSKGMALTTRTAKIIRFIDEKSKI